MFDANFARHSVRPGDGSDLVWSPTDAQDQLIALIDGARSSLRLYSEEMGDATVEKALIAAARRGVKVQVCGENESREYDAGFSALARGGIRISYYSSATGFYIHGKVIEADYGADRTKVFIGSENFSSTSLNPEPRARADHLQPRRDVRDRQHFRRRLRERQEVVLAGGILSA